MERIPIKISKYLDRGKWKIRVSNVTSGFVVHTNEDASDIEFYFDASRFLPEIIVD